MYRFAMAEASLGDKFCIESDCTRSTSPSINDCVHYDYEGKRISIDTFITCTI